jgi:hypothetical protein
MMILIVTMAAIIHLTGIITNVVTTTEAVIIMLIRVMTIFIIAVKSIQI